MIDSGSTESLVGQGLIDSNKCLNSLPRMDLSKTTKLKIANGEYIYSKQVIRIPLNVQGTFITIEALIVPQSFGTVDVIVGTGDLQR